MTSADELSSKGCQEKKLAFLPAKQCPAWELLSRYCILFNDYREQCDDEAPARVPPAVGLCGSPAAAGANTNSTVSYVTIVRMPPNLG